MSKNKIYASRHLTFAMVKRLIENWEALGMSDKQIILMLKSLSTKVVRKK